MKEKESTTIAVMIAICVYGFAIVGFVKFLIWLI
jgi:hypothetical protein